MRNVRAEEMEREREFSYFLLFVSLFFSVSVLRLGKGMRDMVGGKGREERA